MSDGTKVEWADATWNPIRATFETADDVGAVRLTGWHCERVSQGCVNCYAERMNVQRFGTGLPYNRASRDRVKIVLDKRALLLPRRWRKPRRIFVCSMTDLFGEWVPDSYIDQVFAVMALCPQHTFLVLTKRSGRMRAYLTNEDRPWPLPNVWLGTSVEDQGAAERRIPELLATPAAVRFLSCEPLLEDVFIEDFEFCGDGYGVFPGGDPRLFDPDEEVCTVAEVENWKAACVEWDRGAGVDRGPGCATMGDGSVWTGGGFGVGVYTRRSGLDWVVVGGESGPGARPCDLGWIRSLVEQCQGARVPVFVKQYGSRPELRLDSQRSEYLVALRLRDRKGGDPSEWSEDLRVRQWPGVRAGNKGFRLDGPYVRTDPNATASPPSMPSSLEAGE